MGLQGVEGRMNVRILRVGDNLTEAVSGGMVNATPSGRIYARLVVRRGSRNRSAGFRGERCWARVTSKAAERPEWRRAGCQPASRGTQGDGTGAPRTNRSNRAARGVGTKLSGGGCIGLCYVVLFGSRATLRPVIAFRRVTRRNGLAPSRRRARSRAPRRTRGPRDHGDRGAIQGLQPADPASHG